MAYNRKGNGKFGSHNTPISGPKPGASMVNQDCSRGESAIDSNPLCWESATDAYSNKAFTNEYKPLNRGSFY